MVPFVFADEMKRTTMSLVGGWTTEQMGVKWAMIIPSEKKTISNYWIQFQCGYCPIQRNKPKTSWHIIEEKVTDLYPSAAQQWEIQ